MKKRSLFFALASSLLLASCGNQTSFSIKEPSFQYRVGEEVKDEDENSVIVKSLSTDGEYLIINCDLHCDKGDYVSFYYQVQELEFVRFDIAKTDASNKNKFWPDGYIWYTNYDIYFSHYKDLLQNTEYHIDFGVNKTGFASTYFVFSLEDISSISF